MCEDGYHKPYSEVAYDGTLIPLSDAQNRWNRDGAIQDKYREAEWSRDHEQMTWDDVERMLK